MNSTINKALKNMVINALVNELYYAGYKLAITQERGNEDDALGNLFEKGSIPFIVERLSTKGTRWYVHAVKDGEVYTIVLATAYDYDVIEDYDYRLRDDIKDVTTMIEMVTAYL